jgi:hypothetical protein
MPPLAKPDPHETPTAQRAVAMETPTRPGPYDAPTHPSGKTAELAGTELARGDDLAVPVAPRDPAVEAKGSGAARAAVDSKAATRMPAMPPRPAAQIPPLSPATRAPTVPPPVPPPASPGSGQYEAVDGASLDSLIHNGRVEDALAGYRALVKKQPNDRSARAGVELCEGLVALAGRDRMEAAQRFEAALELDPSNERAARELAEMRRQATNERKGLLSRLMGKKEPT